MHDDREDYSLHDIFGANAFTDAMMKEYLPKPTYEALRKTIDEGIDLDPAVADVVAVAMMNWAIKKGATHYSHWFQPMTGVTAGKHDAFISPVRDGKAIVEFSGKELIKGEPDASALPSGGLRVTFEARGYTAWDCTSNAFVKDGALYIPTAFCSYTGEALDKKTPLLRSMEAVSRQAMRVLACFGTTDTAKIITTVGPEQEYFLIDKKLYDQRKDLIFAGRTLFGAKPPKGQELSDHYFGILKDRIAAFMHDLDRELWKLGVAAKTKHNEAAPAQHELAPVFATANIATDHNQLTMEMMKKIALKHDLVCLLHEKPFAGVNGSGKHVNWSLATDQGRNLLEPGHTPQENVQFLIFLCAILKGADQYAHLLCASAASAGNDHRLGANEAPPPIISVFLGNQLTEILERIVSGGPVGSPEEGFLKVGVTTLPALPKDSTDRNRTSPLAFTGNKFEFRMVGSFISIAAACFSLNTIAAEILAQIADRLEKASSLETEVIAIIQEIIKDHGRIIFNGNNYSDEWAAEAEKRGLSPVSSAVDALHNLISEDTIALFTRHGVLDRCELESRHEINLTNYIKAINIESLTMLKMAKGQIVPAAIEFISVLANSVNAVKGTGIPADTSAQEMLLQNISSVLASFYKNMEILEDITEQATHTGCDAYERACFYRDHVLAQMDRLREDGDQLEVLVGEEYWPMPTYGDLLFKA